MKIQLLALLGFICSVTIVSGQNFELADISVGENLGKKAALGTSVAHLDEYLFGLPKAIFMGASNASVDQRNDGAILFRNLLFPGEITGATLQDFGGKKAKRGFGLSTFTIGETSILAISKLGPKQNGAVLLVRIVDSDLDFSSSIIVTSPAPFDKKGAFGSAVFKTTENLVAFSSPRYGALYLFEIGYNSTDGITADFARTISYTEINGLDRKSNFGSAGDFFGDVDGSGNTKVVVGANQWSARRMKRVGCLVVLTLNPAGDVMNNRLITHEKPGLQYLVKGAGFGTSVTNMTLEPNFGVLEIGAGLPNQPYLNGPKKSGDVVVLATNNQDSVTMSYYLSWGVDMSSVKKGDKFGYSLDFVPNDDPSNFYQSLVIGSPGADTIHKDRGRVYLVNFGIPVVIEKNPLTDMMEVEDFDIDINLSDEEHISESERIIVYPNPSSGSAILSFEDSEYRHVEVLNMQGQRIQFHTFEGNKLTLEDLETGSYVILLSNGQTQVSHKLIVQK